MAAVLYSRVYGLCGASPREAARTTTVGGTTSGYSEMGSWNSDSIPEMTIRIDSTAAKTGRLMETSDKSIWRYRLFEAPGEATPPPVCKTVRSCTVIGAPSRTRIRPSVTIVSPAVRPEITSTRPL